MSLNIGDNFSYLGAKPLDTRRVFANKAAMDAVNLSTVYEGMLAYAQAEDKYYRLKSGVWVEFSSGSGGVSDWKANTAYAKNVMVVNGGKLYLCITAHTSGASFDTAEQANWQEVGSGGAGIVLWTTNVKYAIGDIVYYANSLYRCNTAHTSGTFSTDSANWDLMFADLKSWTSSTYYSVGVIVINGGKIYRCKTAHTSGSSFDSTEETNWEAIGGGSTSINDWTASTSYNVGDFVIHANKLYKCITANNDSAWNDTKWQGISVETEIKNWVASTSYKVNDFVIYSGSLYKCINANSDASWTEANWTVISAVSVGRTTTTLWSGKFNTVSPTNVLNLSDLYNSFDELVLDVGGTQSTITNPKKVSTIYQYSDGAGLGASLASEILLTFSGNTATATMWSYGSSLANLQVTLFGRNYVVGSGDGGTTIEDWVASTSYSVGDYVRNNNILYVCKTSHISSSAFSSDTANWDSIKVEDFVGATSSTNGKSGGVPKPMSWNKDNFLKGDGSWSAPYSVNIEHTTLYEGTYTELVTGATITLSGNVSDFDAIQIQFNVWPVCETPKGANQLPWAFWETDATNKDCGHVTFSGNTMNVTFHTIGTNVSSSAPFKVIGVKYTQVSLNVGNFILWEGKLNTDGTSVTLSDNFANYDKVRVYLMGNDYQVYGTTEIIPIRGDTVASIHGSLNYSGFAEFDCYVSFSTNTATLALSYNIAGTTLYVGRIEGIRYYTSTTESNIPDFVGATSTVAGRRGMVPMPTQSDVGKYLCGDGIWRAGGYGAIANRVILWEGSTKSTGVTYNLIDDYTNYDYIIIYCGYANTFSPDSTWKFLEMFDTSKSNLELVHETRTSGSTASFTYIDIDLSGSTFKIGKFVSAATDVYVRRIEGIKFTLPFEYSTIEKKVGKWINGKDVYQITLSGNMSTYTSGIDVAGLNIDELMNISGTFTTLGGVTFPINYYNTSTYWANAFLGYDTTISNKRIFLNFGSAFTGSIDYIVTIQYTKV